MNLMPTRPEVIVIGAGIGGLTAAIRMASAGHRVRVLEALERPGGKANIATRDGVTFDTGPSVLTMPHVFEATFAAAGASFAEAVTLVSPTPAFVYLWPDGSRVQIEPELGDTLQSVAGALGSEARTELENFLRYARRIWEAAEPNFVAGPAPGIAQIVRLGLPGIAAVSRIDAMRSMERGIAAHVKNRRLRDILLRYATYNGSDPRRAPATLNCIAWVELGLGGYGVDGGMYRLVEALVDLATRLGVEIETNCRVEAIEQVDGRAKSVRTTNAEYVAGAVIANADAAHVERVLLAQSAQPANTATRKAAPSTSGHTLVLRSQRSRERVAHTVLFPDNYSNEFVDLFDNNVAPSDPTVYLCAQSQAHNRAGWDDAEPVFVMANAPATDRLDSSDAAYGPLEQTMLDRMSSAGLWNSHDTVVWRRSPAGLATTFPDTDGALYGAASNGMWSAFKRPANRHRSVRGLYLASGSAHPGGGVPLCALSGARAAIEADSYLRGR